MSGNQPPAVKVSSKQRQARALELRKAGLTYQQIADALGYGSHSAAQKAINSALTAMIREPAEALVELELSRLDHMLRGLWPAAIAGNVHAVDRVLKIMERRTRYVGLDKPIQFDVHAMARELAVALELDENEAAELLTEGERFMLDQRKAALTSGLD